MGLDNFPHTYPCQAQGTNIMTTYHWTTSDSDEEHEGTKIDCEATIAAGGCPWDKAPDRPTEGSVFGMFGTHCWYRGKYGNHLAAALGLDDGSFYGTNKDGDHLPPHECYGLADRLEEALADNGGELYQGDTPYTADVNYAIWWLRWTAEVGNGAGAWF
jgi:hypothetical protein